MAGYEKLAAEIQSLSERTATSRPVAAKAMDKLAIGKDFVAESARVTDDLRVTKSLSSGPTLIRHAPADGHTIALRQDSSDNSFRILNETTGNISAYFYPNGKAFIDPLDNSIFSNHISSLAGSKIQVGTLPGTRLQTNTIGFDNYGDNSMGDQKIYSGGVVLNHLSGNTKSQSQGTDSLRRIQTLLGGSSLLASAGNHTHLSVNFNSVYTIEQKETSANLVTQARNMAVQPQLEPLRALVLELAHQLMDEPDHDVVEKVRRIKEDPAYAHEFRMKYDGGYYAAWLIDNDSAYAAKVQDDPRIQEMAAHARQVYARIEDDPTIVEDYKNRRGPFS